MNRNTARNKVERMEKERDTFEQMLLLCEYLTPIVRDAIWEYTGKVDKIGRVELSVHAGIKIDLVTDEFVRSKFSSKGYVNE